MRTSQYIAFFTLLGISAILVIVGLSTMNWWYAESTSSGTTVKSYLGLKKGKVVVSNIAGEYEQTGDIEDSDWLKGGDVAISMATFALASMGGCVVLIALLKLCQGWTGGKARVLGIICCIASAIFIIVGAVSFDQTITKPNQGAYSWSFGLYIAGGLLPLVMAGVLVWQRLIF